LENEVEADLLDKCLDERDVPHAMITYRDTAFNGLFQATRGWGHVEAPEASRQAVFEILKDLRGGAAQAESDDVHDESG
jgi:hypothetical protein